MRLLPALERGMHGELDDLRVEKAEPAEELQALCRQPVDARLDPAMPPLLGVLREEQERRRVAEAELKRDLDLLVVAPRLEKADVRAQPAVEPSAFDARLEAEQRLGAELDLRRRHAVHVVEVDAGERDVEADGLVSAREARVRHPFVRKSPRQRQLAA